MRIRLRTWTFRPPHRVALRVGSGRDVLEVAGAYRDSTWLFDVQEGHRGRQFCFALDSQVVTTRQGHVGPVDIDFGEDDIAFLRPPPIGIDDGRLQQTWFATTRDTDGWDVIVVGTGMGGGVLLGALAQTGNPNRVLGIEAGSLLYPTHVGNLPRVTGEPTAALTSSLWGPYDDFGTPPFESPTRWAGKELYALGGRSLVWGGLCPTLSRHELSLWPADVADALSRPVADGWSYYERARQALHVSTPGASDVELSALRLLDDLVPERDNRSAPVALHRETPTSWRVPGGLYSTAQDLLERRLAARRPDGSYGPPYLHLGEVVTQIEPAGPKSWRVVTTDLRDGERTVYQTRRVVLACGTVETPRILFSSGLVDGLVGKGLTEHPMAYVHFEIPEGSPFHDPVGSAKVISRPAGAAADADDWIVQLELNADVNLGPPSGAPNPGTVVSPGSLAGQLVFMGRADLGADELVGRAHPPWLSTGRAHHEEPWSLEARLGAPGLVPQEWDALNREIVRRLGARRLPGGSPDFWPALTRSGLSFVAHAVGTMRMPTRSGDASVVDTNLEVRTLPGLFVCDLSVFPTSPAANPSLTLAALALRLADYLAL